jgi:hypothetical protein
VIKLALNGLHAVIGILAVAAGLALAQRPSGEALRFETEWLEGSPFPDYRIPGLFLAFVIGSTNLASALAQWNGAHWAPAISLGTGVLLLVWLAIQTSIIGIRDWSQALWLVVFSLTTGLSAWQMWA